MIAQIQGIDLGGYWSIDDCYAWFKTPCNGLGFIRATIADDNNCITFLNLPPSVMAPVQGIIFTSLVLLFLFLRPAGLVGGLGSGRKVPPPDGATSGDGKA